MSIGASAISGMTMGRLHAVMGSRWRRTARIASKSAFLARRRDGAVLTARTGQTERGPQQMLTDAQQHATDRFAKSLLALSDDALIDTYQQALDDHRAARAEGSDNLTKAYAQTLATEKAIARSVPWLSNPLQGPVSLNQLASPFRRTCSWRRASPRVFPSPRPSLRPLPPKPQRTLQTRPIEELLWTSGQDGIARPLRHGRIHCEGGVICQAWRPLWFAAITTCGCEVTPVRSQPFKGALPCPNGTRLRTETERAEAHWGL